MTEVLEQYGGKADQNTWKHRDQKVWLHSQNV